MINTSGGDRSAAGSHASAGPGLEPHSRCYPGGGSSTWPWKAGTVAPGTGGPLHRHRGYFVSEASVYRLLKAHDLITSPAFIVMKAADSFKDQTTAPNQLWQTDFTYLKVIGWGWFYLSTILDDYLPLHHRLEALHHMKAEDVTDTLNLALTASGCDQARVGTSRGCCRTTDRATSRPIWRNGWNDKGMKHVRGAPYHPQTQGKIERWHQTLKNRILLENYYLPGRLEAQIAAFVDHYNHQRYHESSTT
jgi:putative transposase